MKVTLEFNLPEERDEYDLAINGAKYSFIIDDLDDELRKVTKYSSVDVLNNLRNVDDTDNYTKEICLYTVELVRSLLYKIKNERLG